MLFQSQKLRCIAFNLLHTPKIYMAIMFIFDTVWQ